MICRNFLTATLPASHLILKLCAHTHPTSHSARHSLPLSPWLVMFQTAAPSAAAPSKDEEEEEESGEAPDESGLDPDEITTVMNQANCSRAKAVKALKKHKNIVDAILELTP